MVYVMPERARSSPASRVISTYDDASIVSNATNRLNRSPVR